MNEILDALRAEVPRELEARVPMEEARAAQRGRCVQATHVGINALRYFGVEARPLVTKLLTWNAAWAAWASAGMEGEMPDEAWSVGVDPRDPRGKEERGYPAHLVIEVDGHLLDLDAGLYARPERGIHIPPTVLTPLADDERGGAGVDLDEGGGLAYLPVTIPINYRSIGAWKHTGTWAGPVIRRMRQRLDWARESEDVARTIALCNLRHHGTLT